MPVDHGRLVAVVVPAFVGARGSGELGIRTPIRCGRLRRDLGQLSQCAGLLVPPADTGFQAKVSLVNETGLLVALEAELGPF